MTSRVPLDVRPPDREPAPLGPSQNWGGSPGTSGFAGSQGGWGTSSLGWGGGDESQSNGHAGRSTFGSGSSRTGRPPKGYKRSDERIREEVSDMLMRSGIDASEVSLTVSDGEVTLEGTVEDRRTKRAIEDITEDCLGVSNVTNRIRVQASDDSSSRRRSGTDEESRSGRTSGTTSRSGSISNTPSHRS